MKTKKKSSLKILAKAHDDFCYEMNPILQKHLGKKLSHETIESIKWDIQQIQEKFIKDLYSNKFSSLFDAEFGKLESLQTKLWELESSIENALDQVFE